MFPFVYTGRARLPFSKNLRDQIVEGFLKQFRINLRKEKAQDICQTAQQITFTGGFFRFVNNWNMFNFIDKGEIEVKIDGDQLVVSYRLWLVGLFVVGTLMMVFWVFVVAEYFPLSLTNKVLFIGGCWLFFYWFNLCMAVGRFSTFIHNTWWSIAGIPPDGKLFTAKR